MSDILISLFPKSIILGYLFLSEDKELLKSLKVREQRNKKTIDLLCFIVFFTLISTNRNLSEI